ncbi:MAG: ABC transporter substrate-binding protein, partial [Lachnospiraceae bacterium]|nr:ABC transporter substrate-binding protein [Lachnospiraceae bacterium]
MALLLILGISVFAGGCGKDENSLNGQETEGTDGDTVTNEPVAGGEIIVGITQDLDSLDPHKAHA